MANDPFLTIQLIYAGTAGIWRKTLRLAPGSTVGRAIDLSRFIQDNPGYPRDNLKVGVFGKRCGADRFLTDGDRIEIYRPLVFDPMESRRRRATHRKAVIKAPNQS